nr:hypothetical protein [uncultured Bacteroides sp.]
MSAYLGICLADGAFLAADTRRTDVKTDMPEDKIVKKIHKLNNYTAIATGGLGTIGHQAREKVQDIVQGDLMNYNDLVQITVKVFSEAYIQSLQDYPGHKIPLYALLAGRNVEDGKGFICGLSSINNFTPFLLQDKGNKYFAGSNTALVQYVAMTNYNRLITQDRGKIQMDRWAFNSLNEISLMDHHVGYPFQFVKVDKTYVEKFPVKKMMFVPQRDFILKI